jgi:hypothetical protein
MEFWGGCTFFVSFFGFLAELLKGLALRLGSIRLEFFFFWLDLS